MALISERPEGCDCRFGERHDPTNGRCPLVEKMDLPTSGPVRWEQRNTLQIPKGSTNVKIQWALEPEVHMDEDGTLVLHVRSIGASWMSPKRETP